MGPSTLYLRGVCQPKTHAVLNRDERITHRGDLDFAHVEVLEEDLTATLSLTLRDARTTDMPAVGVLLDDEPLPGHGLSENLEAVSQEAAWGG